MKEKIIGDREVEHDIFYNYRQSYRDAKKSNYTWKYKIEMYAKRFGWKPGMIQGDRIYTWDEFNRRCNRLAHGMQSLGIKKEDRVAIVGFNSIEWMEVYFAASKIGAVPVNVNPRFITEEVHYILEDSDAVITFVEEPYAETIAGIWTDLPKLKNVVIYDIGKRPGKVPEKVEVYDDILSADDSNPSVKIYNNDFCFLMYTGGTTGYPKGTVWDQKQRVFGSELMFLNTLIPIFDRLAEYPDDAMHGVSTLLTSNPKLVKIIDKLFSSQFFRKILRLPISKNLVLQLFKLVAGNPNYLKVFLALQKEGTKFLCACPLFHGAGYQGAFTYLGALASTIVFLPTPHPFDAREFWETVEKHKVHTAVIVGDAFSLPIVEELHNAKAEGRTYKLKSLWTLVSSGVRWSPHLKRELLDYMPGLLVIDSMGTSEFSGSFASVTAASDSKVQGAGAKVAVKKGDFLSKQVYHCRVINPKTGKDVTPGSNEIGEFLYGGDIALGYWKCPKKTAHDFKVIDGKRWFFVGDEGNVSKDGKFNLIGRGGDYLINTGGEKVYSEEVEEIVKSLPRVWDTAVIGTPDLRWGQAVTALVEVSSGEQISEEEIIEHCRTKMAGYKRPRRVIFVDKVPRKANGKIDRSTAQELASEGGK